MSNDNTATEESGALEASIEARGNGLPDVGDYVHGTDGELYEVLELGRIHTARRPGGGDWCPARVRLADWDDCPEGEEHSAVASVGGEPEDETIGSLDIRDALEDAGVNPMRFWQWAMGGDMRDRMGRCELDELIKRFQRVGGAS